MALWRFTLELPDGSTVTNVIRAGNRDGALDRLERWAQRREADIVEGPDRVAD